MLESELDLQTHVKSWRGCLPAKIGGASNCLLWDGFQLDKSMPIAEIHGRSFHPTSVKLDDYAAGGITRRHMANVNGTIEIKSLVSRGCQKILS